MNNNINYKSKSIKIKRNSSDLSVSSTTTESEDSNEFDITCSSSLDSCFTIKSVKMPEIDSFSKTLPNYFNTNCFNLQNKSKSKSKSKSKLSSETNLKLNTNKLDDKESCEIKVDEDNIFPFSEN